MFWKGSCTVYIFVRLLSVSEIWSFCFFPFLSLSLSLTLALFQHLVVTNMIQEEVRYLEEVSDKENVSCIFSLFL